MSARFLLSISELARGPFSQGFVDFSVTQTVRVNMDIDLGRSPSSAQSLQGD
jgi:hypothetical protein